MFKHNDEIYFTVIDLRAYMQLVFKDGYTDTQVTKIVNYLRTNIMSRNNHLSVVAKLKTNVVNKFNKDKFSDRNLLYSGYPCSKICEFLKDYRSKHHIQESFVKDNVTKLDKELSIKHLEYMCAHPDEVMKTLGRKYDTVLIEPKDIISKKEYIDIRNHIDISSAKKVVKCS